MSHGHIRSDATVKDRGFDADEIDQVFEDFHRLYSEVSSPVGESVFA
jgi:hypothetical protein